MERGKRTPSFSSLEKIASALNVEIKDLFTFEKFGDASENELKVKIRLHLRNLIDLLYKL